MDQFELRHLRYFLAVAEELHFGRAAKRLNIAQPPLSQQIRQLEAAVGTPLFDRNSRNVKLTPAGTAFVHGARTTLDDAARAAEGARRAGRGESGTLRIGFSDSAALSVLPQMLRRFRSAHPHVHLELNEGATQVQLDALGTGRIDVALVRGPVSSSGLSAEVIFRERFVAAVPEDHPLSARQSVSLSAIASHPLVLCSRHLAPDFHDLIFGMFGQHGLRLNVVHEVEYQTILSLVASGVGISIVPNSVRNLGRVGVAYRPIRGPTPKAEVVAVFAEKNANPLIAWLIDSVNYGRAHVNSGDAAE